MGIRETLNENPRLTTGLTIGIIALVLGFLAWQIWGGPKPGQPQGNTAGMQFFTDDDGKTYFADAPSKIAPFDHNGKEAVEAIVYRCDGKTFVNHVQRYTPEGKKKKDAMAHTAVADGGMDLPQTDVEVKSPGDKDWVKGNDPRAKDIRKPKCSRPEEMEVVKP